MPDVFSLGLTLGVVGGISLLLGIGIRQQGFRPVLVYLLFPYLAFQNVLLPLAAQVVGFAFTSTLLPIKELIVGVGILLSIPGSRGRLSLSIPDAVCGSYFVFLCVNCLYSPADSTSVGLGLRAYSVPVILYLFGRLSWTGRTKDTVRLMRLVVHMGVGVATFGILEYSLSLFGLSPFTELWAEYFPASYGHGAPGSTRSPAFLGLPTLSGTFGNNLITATFLRSSLCVLLAQLAFVKAPLKTTQTGIIALFAVATVLTFSRVGISVLFLILLLVIFGSSPLLNAQKLLIAAAALVALVLFSEPLITVATTTLSVGDPSTYTHVLSITELAKMEFSITGGGLGTGAHSPLARSVLIVSEGEGIFRQGIPEIGHIGVALLLAFSLSVVFSLLRGIRTTGTEFEWYYFWVAAPIAVEILRSPLDIGLRSFLGAGIAWYLAGWFVSNRHHQGVFRVKGPSAVTAPIE